MEGLLPFTRAGLTPAAYREYVVRSNASHAAKAWALGTMFSALAKLGLF